MHETPPGEAHDPHLAIVALLTAAALSGRGGAGLSVLALAAAGATLALLWRRTTRAIELPWTMVILATAATTVAVGVVEFWEWGGAASICALGLGVALQLAVRSVAWGPTMRWVVLILGVVLVGAAGLLAPRPIDVVEVHRAAGQHVLEGTSPFRGLGVVEEDPIVDGSIIDGYPYPPVNILVFALGGLVVGDPRIVGLLLWVGVVVVAARAHGIDSPVPVVLGILPGYPLTVFAGWTEPLVVLLLVVAATTRRVRLRALVVGVMLGSKQYLVGAGPAVLVGWWRQRRWLVIAAASGLIVLVPVLVDLSGARAALIDFHAMHVLRPDSSNLAGVLALRRGWRSWPVPGAGVVVLAGIAGALVARRHTTASGWLAGLVAAVLVTLLVGPVSLPNYWLVVVVGLVLWVAGTPAEARMANGAAAASSSR